MEWIIKYEDYSGNAHCVTVYAHNKQHAIGQLFAVKDIYFIRQRARQISEEQMIKAMRTCA